MHFLNRKRENVSPLWRQAITWTNADLLSAGPLGTNFNEIRIKIHDDGES